MILVTGATGSVGGELARTLAARGLPVRALVRDPVGPPSRPRSRWCRVTSSVPETLRPALAGVDRVFLLGGFPPAEILRRIRAAGANRVVLLTSRCVVGGNPDNAVTRMWLDAEAAVRDSGLLWTILRPSGFHSNALRWLPQLRQGDVVRAPWPNVSIASIDPADIAAVAASRAHRARTRADLARAERPGAAHPRPSRSTSSPRYFVDHSATSRCPMARHAPAMAVDTPPPLIDAFFRFFTDGEFDDSRVIDTVHRITGHPPGSFGHWADAHVHLFGRGA